MTGIAASFGKPFAFQLAAYRLRLAQLQPTFAWTDVWKSEHDRAFMVAGAVKADILADLAAMVDKAVTQGTTLEEFRRDFRSLVAEKGWQISKAGQGTKKGEAWRTRVIYKTNMATSYAAGRWAQLKAANYPFLVYKHGGSLHPREQHLAWDGLVLEADHPFWASHAPPNGWGCSCYVNGARSKAAARRVGGKPDKGLPVGWQKLDPKTGAPVGIDKGWDYAPGASVADAVIALVEQKVPQLPASLGSDLGLSAAALVSDRWRLWVATTIADEGRAKPAMVGVIGSDVIEALSTRDIAVRSAEIMVRPGLVAGPKATRHLAKGDALTPDEWMQLPLYLRAPKAVLIDTDTGRLIYLLDMPDRDAQLAVHLDYLKKGEVTNMVVSAYHPVLEEIRRRVSNGGLRLLVGLLG